MSDWRVIIDDTGDFDTGWPSVWSDKEDRSVIHTRGFIQEHWHGPTLKEAKEIAQLVADFMNKKSNSSCPHCNAGKKKFLHPGGSYFHQVEYHHEFCER